MPSQSVSRDSLDTLTDLDRRLGRLEREWSANMTEVIWLSADRTTAYSGFRAQPGGSIPIWMDSIMYGDHFGFIPGAAPPVGEAQLWPRIGGIYLVQLRGKIVMPSSLDDQPVMVKKLLSKVPASYANSDEWGSPVGLNYYLNMRQDIRESVTSESRDLQVSIEGIADFLGENDNEPLAAGPLDVVFPFVHLAWSNSISSSDFTVKGGAPEDPDTFRLSMTLLAETPPSAL